jgi:hypothetical protein
MSDEQPRKRPRNAHAAKRLTQTQAKRLADADKLATRREAAQIAAYTMNHALQELDAFRNGLEALRVEMRQALSERPVPWWQRVRRWFARAA